MNLEVQRSQYTRPKVTVHKGAETIQGRKLLEGGNYMRKYGSRYKHLALNVPLGMSMVKLLHKLMSDLGWLKVS